MKMYPIVILAGGMATRLYPITKKIPKALVKVGNRPFVEHQLRLLKHHGFTHVIISSWYKGEMIQDFVGNGNRFGLNVDFVFDGPKPLGTGGAIKKATSLIEGPFYSLYGDSYLPCNYQAIQSFFKENQKPALMTVFLNQDQWDKSNVEVVDGEILTYEKTKHNPSMQHIDYGLSVFLPEVFDWLKPDTPYSLVDVYQQLIRVGDLVAYVVNDRFYEIGSFKGLKELDALLSEDPNRFLKKEM
jgi:NDP-sugar pyrophosphorylase family protein